MSKAALRRRALATATALPRLGGVGEGGVGEGGVGVGGADGRKGGDSRASLLKRAAGFGNAPPSKHSARSRLQSKSAKGGGCGRKGEAATPLQWQEKHSPTRTVTFWESLEEDASKSAPSARSQPSSGRWRAVRRQQRVVDAKLWRHLTPGQQAAAERIYRGFARLSRGLGAGGCALGAERVDGAGRSDPDLFQAQVRDYLTWGQRCQQQAIDQAAVMAVLGEGRSCLEVDRLRRRRKGYARLQLGEGLSLYCQMKGWNPA